LHRLTKGDPRILSYALSLASTFQLKQIAYETDPGLGVTPEQANAACTRVRHLVSEENRSFCSG
jgi:hypothetical protein